MRKVPYITIILSAAALIAYGLAMSMQFDRAAMYHEASWRVGLRLASCQWTHWSANHLLWDLGVFIALGAACELKHRRAMLLSVATAAIGVPTAVFVLNPQLPFFRGLSGVDCALFGCLVTLSIFEGWTDRKASWRFAITAILWLIFAAKTAIEFRLGRTLFVQSSGEFVVVPVAHLAGFLIGSTAAVLAMRLNRHQLNFTAFPVRALS